MPDTLQPPVGTDDGGDPAAAQDARPLAARIKGRWSLDLSRSDLPEGLSEAIAGEVTAEFAADGGYTIDADRLDITTPMGTAVARLTITGRLDAGEATGDGPFAATLGDIAIPERHFDFSGLGIPMDLSFIVDPMVDAFAQKAPTAATVALVADGDMDVLSIAAGETVHRLTRLRTDANVTGITFENDLRVMFDVVANPMPCVDDGVPVVLPHWSPGFNQPASFLPGDEVKLTVDLVVKPAGLSFHLYGIDKVNAFMNFESGVMVATGEKQTVILVGKARLPKRLGAFVSDLMWNIRRTDEDQEWTRAGITGPHRMFTMKKKPEPKTSIGTVNHPTVPRLNFALGVMTGWSDKDTLDLHKFAEALQHAVNEKVAPAGQVFADTRPMVPDLKASNHVWGLLDDNSPYKGQCGEATLLMEQCLRALGLPAVQTHVFASSRKQILDAGMNIGRFDDHGNPIAGGAGGLEKRHCPLHGVEESLEMNFSTTSDQPLRNEGEGCVEVDHVLYSGLINMVARDSAARKAPYDMLLQLEADFSHTSQSPKTLFQVWMGPGPLACTYGVKPGDPPGVPVPK